MSEQGRAEKEVMRLSRELRKSNKMCENLSQIVESLTARLKEAQEGSGGSNDYDKLVAENKALLQERNDLQNRVAELEQSGAPTSNCRSMMDLVGNDSLQIDKDSQYQQQHQQSEDLVSPVQAPVSIPIEMAAPRVQEILPYGSKEAYSSQQAVQSLSPAAGKVVISHSPEFFASMKKERNRWHSFKPSQVAPYGKALLFLFYCYSGISLSPRW